MPARISQMPKPPKPEKTEKPSVSKGNGQDENFGMIDTDHVGIKMLKRPSQKPSLGMFELPVEFDEKRFASKYVKKGNDVVMASQREPIAGTQFSADGWNVWKNENNEDKPHEVTVSDGTYILLFRPIKVQESVNRLAGEFSRQRMSSEQQGETIAGQENRDPGMLGEARLSRELGREEQEEPEVKMF